MRPTPDTIKKTILSALENEKNPADGRPAFPPAVCSRLYQGYPVLFNHLGINGLEKLCAAELVRTENLLERQFYKRVEHHPLLPMLLVFREGAKTDARQLKSETEKFVKTGALQIRRSVHGGETGKNSWKD